MTIHIEMIGGNCPLQAEGTIDGVPFYFRARGQRWSMGVGGDPLGHPSDMPETNRPDWYCECTWGTKPFAAGWMPEDEARRLIDWCASEYARNRISASRTADLTPAEVSDAANEERRLEPNIGPVRDAGDEATS